VWKRKGTLHAIDTIGEQVFHVAHLSDQPDNPETTNPVFAFIDLTGQYGNPSLAKSSLHHKIALVKRKANCLYSKPATAVSRE
jgi:hypothetical protein